MYDLAIIGAGPAGSTAGRRAGKLGLKTLIIEKEEFPRYKPCGGALSEQAMSYLDFTVPSHLHEKEVYGARVHYEDQVIEKHKEYRIATLVTRSVLDNYMLSKAKEVNVKINMGEKVNNCEEEEKYVVVNSTKDIYKAKFVIIAEGAHGKLKKIVRNRIKKNEFGICMVTEIEEINKNIDQYIFNAIDIHLGVVDLGYGWIFPHDNYYSVGVGGIAKGMPQTKTVIKNFLQANGFTSSGCNLRGHLIPVGGIKRKLSSSRIILCGDAAGLVDFFCGEGIAYAIRSGQIAVELIYDVLMKTKKIPINKYEFTCEREFGNNLKYSLLLSKMMHRFPWLFLKTFTKNTEMISKFLEVPARKSTYKDFIDWLMPKIPKHLLNTCMYRNNQKVEKHI